MVSNLDGTLSDLRKYGFTFITALLAADSILGETTTGATIVLSPQVKLAVFASTLILVAGLYATDKFYMVVQQAAAERAIEIENHFKTVTLTHIIGKFYSSRLLWLYVDLLYVFFALACETLGMIVLYPSYSLMFFITLATALTMAFIALLPRVGRRPNLYPSPNSRQGLQ
jgi:hypothetical protein